MLYRRVETLGDLQAACTSTEGLSLDFKASKTTKEPEWRELSKDIAAFANHIGGVILAGANENSDNTATAFGLAPAEAKRLQAAYEAAARDKCLPRPIVTCKQIVLDSKKVVVAVNIEPYPDQLVGAMFPDWNQNDKPITSDAWRFYVRIGKDNIALTPDKLAMFMNADIRRTVIRLESIPSKDVRIFVVWRNPTNQVSANPQEEHVSAPEVDVPANVFACDRAVGEQAYRLRIPLDDVDAVWEATPGRWLVRVTGYLADRDQYISNPSNAVFRRT